MSTKIRTFFVLFAAVMCIGLAGCENTIHGAGEDMERAGESVQDSVD